MEKTDIKSLDYDELKDFFVSIGEKPFRAKQVYQWMHENLADGFEEMTNLSKNLREKLAETCEYTCLENVQTLVSELDGTRKYLFRLSDGYVVESVLMRYQHGNSVCISTQVGCRMGCKFCASTLEGCVRSLTAGEMLAMRLAVLHNLYFYNALMDRIRLALEEGTFEAFYREYREKLGARM